MINIKKILSVSCMVLLIISSSIACKPDTTPIDDSSAISSSEQSQDSKDSSTESSQDVSLSEDESSASESSDSSSSSDDSSDSSETPAEATPTNSANVTPTKGATAAPTPTKTPEEIANLFPGRVADLKGRTIRLNHPPLVAANAADKNVERFMQRVEEIEEKFNCTIVLDHTISESAGNTSIATSVMSGNPKVDIWYQNGWLKEFLPHYVAGMLQPLDNLKVFDFTDLDKFRFPTLYAKANDKYYAVSFSDNGIQGNMMMFFNQEVLDACGVTDDLYSIMDQGQWTWDKFAEISNKVNQASGDYLSVNDADGLLYQALLFSYGTDFAEWNPNTSKLSFTGGNTAAVNALTHYTNLTKNGTISVPDLKDNTEAGFGWWAMFGRPEPGFIKSDKVAFSVGSYLAMKWVIGRTDSTQGIRDNFGMLYIPKVKASDAYVSPTSVNQTAYYAIPQGVLKPAEVATIIDALCEPEDVSETVLRNEQLAGYLPYLNARTGTQTRALMNQLLDKYYADGLDYYYNDLATGCGVYGDWMDHVGKIANGSENASTVITSVNDSFNSRLTSIFRTR